MPLTQVPQSMLSSDLQAATYAFKNRIINGAMVIDQRNAGASVSIVNGGFAFAVDRTSAYKDTTATATVQRSTVAPAGFTNSLLYTVTASGTVAAGGQNLIQQLIEGFNVSDLAWGTADAQAITISFRVRSSLTGTFGLGISNSAANRVYVATYSISAANTWETKSITIPGDTSGTWLTDNGIGIRVRWDLGSGSTYQGTAGSWGSTLINTTSAQVIVPATNGATFYITGVQLEKGSTATSFDYRPYGTELALCQRYYFKIGPAAAGDRVAAGYAASATVSDTLFAFPVTMRTAPTALEQTGTAADYSVQQASGNTACSAVPTFQTATNQTAATRQTVASGLTTGQGNFARLQTTSGYFAWSAEL